MENDVLKKIFNPNTWNGWKAFTSYEHSGMNLIDEINKLDPDLVIDVGCGHNRFKGHIKNLIGFDLCPFPYADLHMSIDEINFRPQSADVLLALGSIQFENRNKIEHHLDRVVSWVKPGGYIVMRIRHKNLEKEFLKNTHHLWTDEDLSYFTERYQMTIDRGPWVESVKKSDGTTESERLTWWWKMPGVLKKYSIDPISCNIKERDDNTD